MMQHFGAGMIAERQIQRNAVERGFLRQLRRLVVARRACRQKAGFGSDPQMIMRCRLSSSMTRSRGMVCRLAFMIAEKSWSEPSRLCCSNIMSLPTNPFLVVGSIRPALQI